MKKVAKIISIVSCTTLLVVGMAFADGINVKDLDVKSDNTIKGDINATNKSTVTVGDTTITNSTADQIHSSTTNETNAIKADQGTVQVGKVDISGIEGGKVNIDTTNKATGTLDAKNGGVIDLGSVSVSGAKNADIDVKANNTVKDITADDAVVQVGTTNLQNINGGTLKVSTTNKVDGKIEATGGSKVSVGHTGIE